MKRLLFIFSLTLLLSGCASMYDPPVGITEAQLVQTHGKPTARYQEGNLTLLEYASGFWGQHAYFATMDRQGRLVKWEQVLTEEKFATLVPGKSTKADILRTIGHPADITRIRLNNYEVWTYRYLGSLTWPYVMHFMFDPKDPTGTLQRMESGIDLLYDPGN